MCLHTIKICYHYFKLFADDTPDFIKRDKTFCDFAFVNQHTCYRKFITSGEFIDGMPKSKQWK